MGHTPGPWRVEKPGEIDEHYAVLDRFGHTASVYGYPEEAAVALANARLIAAAPELLAGLRQILLKQQTGEGDFSVARLCLALITKAEGRGE